MTLLPYHTLTTTTAEIELDCLSSFTAVKRLLLLAVFTKHTPPFYCSVSPFQKNADYVQVCVDVKLCDTICYICIRIGMFLT